MMYLPRICEHCLNPSCVASCPSGAMYKREEDGIVLVDQEKCRGWRMCVSRLPLQEGLLQLEDRQGREVHALLPAHRGRACRRSARRPASGASATSGSSSTTPTASRRPPRCPTSTICSTRSSTSSSTPTTPRCREQARRDGIPEDWIEAARRSPVYALAMDWRIALPLHPEYRTLPMVWYVPPLSPVMSLVEGDGSEADPDDVFPAIDELRIPVEYLANLLTRRRRGRRPRRPASGSRRCARTCARDLIGARADPAIAAARRDERRRDRGHVPAAARSPSTTTAT